MNWDRGDGSSQHRPQANGQQSAAGGVQAVDVAVLAELRAIREQITKLAEKVGAAATRDEVKRDLDDYVTKREFDAHVTAHQRLLDGWRGWLPIVVSGVALLWIMVGPYVHFGPR